jgi:hypothetical protein
MRLRCETFYRINVMSVEPYNLEELIQSGKQAEVLVNEGDLSLPSPSGEGISAEERDRRSEEARVVFELEVANNLPTQVIADWSDTATVDAPGSDWRETYKILKQAGWPWRIAVYIAWMSSPRKNRWPKTQEELATQVLGLTSDRVFTQWRQKYPTIEDVIATMQAAPLWAHRSDVINALVESASNPDHRSNPDRKVFLGMVGDYTPKQEIKVRGSVGMDEDLADVSEGELLKRAKTVKKDTTGE